jgi:hypothetical protein
MARRDNFPALASLAAAGILTGLLDVLASRGETQGGWAGNAINVALAGAAWVVADAIAQSRWQSA